MYVTGAWTVDCAFALAARHTHLPLTHNVWCYSVAPTRSAKLLEEARQMV